MSSQDDYRDQPVRPYVITQGRARPSRNTIRPETLLVASDPGSKPPITAAPEERGVLHLCQWLLSLAEVAAHLQLPVSLVAVVASDLVDAGYLTIRSGTSYTAHPDTDILEEVLDGLRRLC